jgi:hypothetical protein
MLQAAARWAETSSRRAAAGVTASVTDEEF